MDVVSDYLVLGYGLCVEVDARLVVREEKRSSCWLDDLTGVDKMTRSPLWRGTRDAETRSVVDPWQHGW